MNADNITKFIVIGVGRIGKRHIAMIDSLPHAELVATVDTCSKEDLELNGNTPHFHHLDDVFEAGLSADIVAIATPNGLHAGQALRALHHDCHVIIEKPMALTKSDAEEVLHMALQKGKLVFGVMQNRYSPPSEWLKGIVEDGKLGRIFQVHIDCFWNRDHRYYHSDGWHGTKSMDGGTLFTQFSHFIDILYWVFGDIDPIAVQTKNFNHQDTIDFEDSGMIHFKLLRDDALGSLNYSTSVWDANLESSMTVIGEKGSIKIAGQYMNEVVHCHVEDYDMPKLSPSNPPNNYGPYKGSAANHIYVYENVMQVLRGEGPITTNALEGLKVVDIIEKVYSLAKEH